MVTNIQGALQSFEAGQTKVDADVSPGAPSSGGVGGTGKGGFGEVLLDAVEQAASAEREAEATATAFADGKAGIHETVLAQERASIAIRFAMTMKTKAIDAYREIMNTQI